MASVIVPIPNQPVYTWQMSFSSIGMRGNVIGTATTIPIYESVITGTQSILYIPVTYTGRDHKGRIYIHGFHLAEHSILGATRYRIPMIVRIWNYVLTGINVIANIMDMDHHVNVIATASHDTGAMHHTYLHLGGIETINWIKLCFTITGIKRMIYTMYTSLPDIRRKYKVAMQNLEDLIIRKFRSCTDIMTVERTYKTSVSNLRDTITTRMKVGVSVLTQIIENIFKLKTDIANSDIERSFKLQVKLWGSELVQTLKLSVSVLNAQLYRTIKLSVDITGKVLQGIMSYILFLLESYDVEKTLNVHIPLAPHTREERNIIKFDATLTERISNIHSHLVQHIKTAGWTIFQLLQSIHDRLLKMDIIQSLKNSMISIWTAPEWLNRELAVHTKAESFQAALNLFIHTEQFRDEKVLLEIDLMSWLGETTVKFDPTNHPRANTLNVMITVCETWVLAYLSFIPDELINHINVRMSTCSHEMSSILQWYLHGGRVSNHGGNEVIFDLGDVDPIGPIPPVPSRQWEGGWVEDPFKGVGYIPAADSTGYGSPSVQDWLSNVNMFWDNASEPFIKKGGTP